MKPLHVAILLAAFALIQALQAGFADSGLDYGQVWINARWLRIHHSEAVYMPAQGKRLLPLKKGEEVSEKLTYSLKRLGVLGSTGTPYFYSLFVPIAFHDYDLSFKVFQAASTLATLFSIVVLGRLMKCSGLEICLFLILASWFGPLQADSGVSNVSRLLLGGLALYAWLDSGQRKHGRIAGLVLGMLLAFKPILLPFAAFQCAAGFLAQGKSARNLDHLLGIIYGGLLALLISALAFKDFLCWAEWYDLLSSWPQINFSVRMGNIALPELFGMAQSKFIRVWQGFVFVGLTVLLWKILRRHRNDAPREIDLFALSFALGFLFLLLATRLVWLHYVTLAVPLVIYQYSILRDAPSMGRQKRGLLFLALGAFLVILCRQPYALILGEISYSWGAWLSFLSAAGLCILPLIERGTGAGDWAGSSLQDAAGKACTPA